MKKTFKIINKIIKKYETIVIARHVFPDLDSLGCQFALKEWININYPNKKVYCLGENNFKYNGNFFSLCDQISDIEVEFLGICLDVNTIDRIDNKQLFVKASETICIDHHCYEGELEFDYYYVDCKRISCAEIVAEILMACRSKKMNKKMAKFLYSGIVSDSADFYYEASNEKTLLTASKLIRVGKFNSFNDVNMLVRQNSYYDLKMSSAIIDEIIFEEGFAYYVIKIEKQKELGITSTYATQKIYRFNRIEDFEIVLAAAEETQGIYRCSIRSKTISIVEIATKYGGGGHKNACGVKNLTIEQLVLLRKDLKNLLNKEVEE